MDADKRRCETRVQILAFISVHRGFFRFFVNSYHSLAPIAQHFQAMSVPLVRSFCILEEGATSEPGCSRRYLVPGTLLF